MTYKVAVTRDAEEDLDNFIKYLIIEKKNISCFVVCDTAAVRRKQQLNNLTKWII